MLPARVALLNRKDEVGWRSTTTRHRHEHGNVDCAAQANLKGIDGKGHVDTLLTARLRHGQVPGLNPRMH